MNPLVSSAFLAVLLAGAPASASGPIAVVAAENFYGDIAQQIGGSDVKVTSILSNPDQDPHLFEASPSVARALSAARIVIYNGIDYDPWMAKLLRAAAGHRRKAIVVAELVGRKTGDNPHIWYDPTTMPALARALAAELSAADPERHAQYQQRLARFMQSMQPIKARIAGLRRRLAGMPVTATEPVFGYMLAALRMKDRSARFQLAVMNNTEPAASDVAAFEDDLKNRRVRMLVYNRQASDPVARRMVRLAEAAHIPIVGASETEPPGTDYQAWIESELDAVDRALPK
ncbi:MAG TPA: zinc ABC transporter substrate-binding protein [Stellaceae bacterium]|nr:zinc ABC transporter substrate-binding protein [Stellaceae bacterium]